MKCLNTSIDTDCLCDAGDFFFAIYCQEIFESFMVSGTMSSTGITSDFSETILFTYLIIYLLNYFLNVYLLQREVSFWETKRVSASQEIPPILWNPKVHYRIQNARRHSLASNTAIQSIPSKRNSWRSILVTSSHLGLGFPSGQFLLVFPTKTITTPLNSPNVLYAPPKLCFPINHPKNICWWVQIIKHFNM